LPFTKQNGHAFVLRHETQRLVRVFLDVVHDRLSVGQPGFENDLGVSFAEL